jgi:D-aminoacyl-tRNA deacylase
VRAVCQRVAHAEVRVGGQACARIGVGLLVLLGVGRDDAPPAADRLGAKIARLRIFEDESGKFDRSILDAGGSVLVVSQFTLFGDTSRGNRPSFSAAAEPKLAEQLYERFCNALREEGVAVQTGVFGAKMQVELVNDGPVTVLVEI